MVLALWKYAVVSLAFILPHTSACVVIETLTNLYRVIAGLCPQHQVNWGVQEMVEWELGWASMERVDLSSSARTK